VPGALGWLSAATNAGVALGPLLGSATHTMGARGPDLVAAALCTLNMVFAWRYLNESRDMTEAAESKAAGPSAAGRATRSLAW
jgi:predicted MFS family arabinose efflux permease